MIRARAAAALAAAALFAVASADGGERRVQVQGRITDPEGNGLGGHSVRLLKTQRGILLEKFSSGGKVAEAARVTTDESGFYQIDVPRDRAFDDYYLRFYDPESFDQVQYLLPPDREITKELRRREILRVDVVLRRGPSWPEVRLRLDAVGEDSPKGRVLRAMGIPEREGLGEGPDGPREEWWYYSRGVVYFFRDGKAAGFRRFEPVAAAPAAGGAVR